MRLTPIIDFFAEREGDVELRIAILTGEKMFDAAWAAVQAHGASTGVKQALAKASEAAYPGGALQVYAERVEELVNAGGNPAYAEACKLVARMADLRGAAEQAAYAADLKARFRRKRNFMKLLGWRPCGGPRSSNRTASCWSVSASSALRRMW